jgi:hypothetical protein
MSTIKTTTLSTQGGSTVPVDTVVNGTAKAWVNFNGTGAVAIRRAFNVSSITDNGTGDYTVNFATAMVDANYSAQALVGVTSSQRGGAGPQSYTTSAFHFVCVLSAAVYDPDLANVAIFS